MQKTYQNEGLDVYGSTHSGTRIIGTVGIQSLRDCSMTERRQTTFTDDRDCQYSETKCSRFIRAVKNIFAARTAREPLFFEGF